MKHHLPNPCSRFGIFAVLLGALGWGNPVLAAAAKKARPDSADTDPFASTVEPGKKFVYKQSGGAPQELEVYFPPNWRASGPAVPGVILFHGFFNRPPWQDLTLAEADRFLVRHGFLRGSGTLAAPGGGEKLVRAP